MYLIMVHLDLFLSDLIDKDYFPSNSVNGFRNIISDEIREHAVGNGCFISVNRVYVTGVLNQRFLVSVQGVPNAEMGCIDGPVIISCDRSDSRGGYSYLDTKEETFLFPDSNFHKFTIRHDTIFKVNIIPWCDDDLRLEDRSEIIVHLSLRFKSEMDHIKKSFFLPLTSTDNGDFHSAYLGGSGFHLTDKEYIGVSSVRIPPIRNIRPPFNRFKIKLKDSDRMSTKQMELAESLIGFKFQKSMELDSNREDTVSLRVPDDHRVVAVEMRPGNYTTTEALYKEFHRSIHEAFDTTFGKSLWVFDDSKPVLWIVLGRQMDEWMEVEDGSDGVCLYNNTAHPMEFLMEPLLAKVMGLHKELYLESRIENIMEGRFKEWPHDEDQWYIRGDKCEPFSSLPTFIAITSPMACRSFVGQSVHQMLTMFTVRNGDVMDEGGLNVNFPVPKFVSTTSGFHGFVKCALEDPFSGKIFFESSDELQLSFYIK